MSSAAMFRHSVTDFPRVLPKIFSCSNLEDATLVAMTDNTLAVSCRSALTTRNEIFIQNMPSVSTFKERTHKGTSMFFRLPTLTFGSEITERMSIIFFMVS